MSERTVISASLMAALMERHPEDVHRFVVSAPIPIDPVDVYTLKEPSKPAPFWQTIRNKRPRK